MRAFRSDGVLAPVLRVPQQSSRMVMGGPQVCGLRVIADVADVYPHVVCENRVARFAHQWRRPTTLEWLCWWLQPRAVREVSAPARGYAVPSVRDPGIYFAGSVCDAK